MSLFLEVQTDSLGDALAEAELEHALGCVQDVGVPDDGLLDVPSGRRGGALDRLGRDHLGSLEAPYGGLCGPLLDVPGKDGVQAIRGTLRDRAGPYGVPDDLGQGARGPNRAGHDLGGEVLLDLPHEHLADELMPLLKNEVGGHLLEELGLPFPDLQDGLGTLSVRGGSQGGALSDFLGRGGLRTLERDALHQSLARLHEGLAGHLLERGGGQRRASGGDGGGHEAGELTGPSEPLAGRRVGLADAASSEVQTKELLLAADALGPEVLLRPHALEQAAGSAQNAERQGVGEAVEHRADGVGRGVALMEVADGPHRLHGGLQAHAGEQVGVVAQVPGDGAHA